MQWVPEAGISTSWAQTEVLQGARPPSGSLQSEQDLLEGRGKGRLGRGSCVSKGSGRGI